jgi:hypothetical protein
MPGQKTTQNSTHECVVCYQELVNERVFPIPTQGVSTGGTLAISIQPPDHHTPGKTYRSYKPSILYDLRSVIKLSLIESEIRTVGANTATSDTAWPAATAKLKKSEVRS